MLTKAELREMHRDLKSWRKIGLELGLPARTVWRYAMTDYEPRRADIRAVLGLDDHDYEITYVRQVRRRSNGTFIDGEELPNS